MDLQVCHLPVSSVRLQHPLVSGVVGGIAATLSDALALACDQLDEELSGTDEVASVLRALTSTFAGATELMRESQPVSDVPSIDESIQCLSAEIVGENLLNLSDPASKDALFEIFTRYDTYFGTRRSSSLSADDQFFQLCRTASQVCNDLSMCLLDLKEISSILRGLEAAVDRMANGSSPIQILPASQGVDDHGKRAPSDIALFRWKLGHHLFNLLTSHATSVLVRCAGEVLDGSQVILLDTAAVLLRGTTAAMWYAEAFPAKLYLSFIRPTMIEASGTGSGFSGTDNLEFRLFKLAVEYCFSSLASRYGAPQDWPEPVWLSAYRFLDCRQLDLEHHTILAEKLVGNLASLKQVRSLEKNAKAEIVPEETPAVEALRGLAHRARMAKERLV